MLIVKTAGANAQISSLYLLQDVINIDTPGVQNIYHSLSFTLPEEALSINPTDYIQITLPNFTDLTVPLSVSGPVGGTPVYSIEDNTIKITGITVLPGRSITIEGFTATNPPFSHQFQVYVSVTEDEEGLLVKNTGSTIAAKSNGIVSVTAQVETPQGRLELSGFTSPNAFVLITEGSTTIGTGISTEGGFWQKLFPVISPTTHYINIHSIDSENRSSSIVPLTINTPVFQTTTVSNLLLSPTIEIQDTEFLQGEDIYATGSAYPGTSITLFTESPVRTYTASTSATGLWTTTINDTASYNPGDYKIYSMAQTGGGLQSLMSPSILFQITTTSGGSGSACGDITKGDLNCDDIINLTDFSIMMYYWGTTNATADMNSDGIVNLTDFSIMMYYWGT